MLTAESRRHQKTWSRRGEPCVFGGWDAKHSITLLFKVWEQWHHLQPTHVTQIESLCNYMIPLSLCCVLFTTVAAAQTNNWLRARRKVKDTTVAPEMSAGTLPEGRKALSLFTPSHLVGARLKSQPGSSEVTTRIIYLLLVTLSIKMWVHPVSGLWKLYAKKVKSHLWGLMAVFPRFYPTTFPVLHFCAFIWTAHAKSTRTQPISLNSISRFTLIWPVKLETAHLLLCWSTFFVFPASNSQIWYETKQSKKKTKTQKKYFPDWKGMNVCGCLWFVMQRTRRHSLRIQQPPHKTGRKGLLPAPPHVQTQLGLSERWKQTFTDNNSVHRTASLINKRQKTKKQSS